MICNAAYSELNFIISKMSEELREKIPIEFIEFIEKNDNKQYQINAENIKDLELHEDDKRILSVIYTDYIATDEERRIIKNKEEILELKKEAEKKEKYGTDIFENKENHIKKSTNDKTAAAMIIKYKEKWYKVLFNKIKKLFRI